MLILAFDTATDVATSALVSDAEVLGERTSLAGTLLEDVDAFFRQASARPRDLDALVVGTGPGSFTGTRVGIAVARGLGLALARLGNVDPVSAQRLAANYTDESGELRLDHEASESPPPQLGLPLPDED